MSALRRQKLRRQAGFTLVEVMIALLILGMGLGVLLRSASGNLAATRRAEMFAVATELGRAKMYDLEETLLEEGFQQLDQELDGDFEEEGWENITWEATIEKIELPNLEALTAVSTSEDGEGGGGSGVLGAMLGFLPPLGAGGQDVDASAAAGASFMSSQYQLISNVFEESIRKVKLTIKWKNGRFTGDLVLDCYFTDPAAISRALGGLGALGSSSSNNPSSSTNPASSNNPSSSRRGGQ